MQYLHDGRAVSAIGLLGRTDPLQVELLLPGGRGALLVRDLGTVQRCDGAETWRRIESLHPDGGRQARLSA